MRLSTAATTPARFTPIQVPPPVRSRPATTPGRSGQCCGRRIPRAAEHLVTVGGQQQRPGAARADRRRRPCTSAPAPETVPLSDSSRAVGSHSVPVTMRRTVVAPVIIVAFAVIVAVPVMVIAMHGHMDTVRPARRQRAPSRDRSRQQKASQSSQQHCDLLLRCPHVNGRRKAGSGRIHGRMRPLPKTRAKIRSISRR